VQAGAHGYTDPCYLSSLESHGCVTRAYLWSRSCTDSMPVGTRSTQKWIVISLCEHIMFSSQSSKGICNRQMLENLLVLRELACSNGPKWVLQHVQ
jgi:hypothetical protein